MIFDITSHTLATICALVATYLTICTIFFICDIHAWSTSAFTIDVFELSLAFVTDCSRRALIAIFECFVTELAFLLREIVRNLTDALLGCLIPDEIGVCVTD